MARVQPPNPGLQVCQADARILTAPLRVPFRIATGQHDVFANPFLRLELADGSVGWGEAGVAPHITGETLEQTQANLRRAANDLIGQDLGDYRNVCARLEKRHRQNPAAQQAVEMAILDALARSCHFPFWRFFGHRPKRLQSDITIVIGSLREAAASTTRYLRRGFRTFKIKIGADHSLDQERVRAVARQAPGCDILLDANQGFSAEDMLRFLKELRQAKIHPLMVEQPVPRGDWEGLTKLTRESGTLICADESIRGIDDALFAVKTGAVKVINLKFAKTGIIQTLEIARLARASGLRLMIGAMMESTLSITAAAHFAAGFGSIEFIDLDTTFFIKGKLAQSPVLDHSGNLDVRRVSHGIGVTPKA